MQDWPNEASDSATSYRPGFALYSLIATLDTRLENDGKT